MHNPHLFPTEPINLRKQEKTQSSSNDWVFSYSDLVNHLLFLLCLFRSRHPLQPHRLAFPNPLGWCRMWYDSFLQ